MFEFTYSILKLIFSTIFLLKGNTDNICAPGKDLMQCNDKGLCQCCLTNGTAVRTELSDHLKSCACPVKMFEAMALPPIGRITPKCREDGTFHPFQSHGSTGLSWCVHPTTGENTTEKARGEYTACKCEKIMAEPTDGTKMVGKFVPNCEVDGTYTKLQTRASTGMSWCVEPESGDNVTETARGKYQSCECFIEKHLAKRKPSMGRFTPKCQENGMYVTLQSHPSTGMSWCVEPKTGQNITEKARGEYTACKCEKIMAEATDGATMVGKFVPNCEEDGSYAKLQSHASTGMSWCVEPETGNNVTEKARGKYQSCECFLEKHLAKEKPPMGSFTPKCQEDGMYVTLQSHPSTGMSWCVEPKTGQNVTEQARGVYNNCQCLVERHLAKGENKVGQFVPKCEADGNYTRKQLHSSTGKSYCADPETGDKLIEANRGEDLLCDCVVEKHLVEKKNLLGAFKPSCEKDGTYSKKQVNPSIGMSYCVDPQTGKKTTEPARGEVTCE